MTAAPMKFAYADPPYLGCCRLYKHEHPDGRCWDDLDTHQRLIDHLGVEFPDGWAMSATNHHSGKQYADAIDAALGANGYVVVPRHLLDELLDHTARLPVPSDDFDLLGAARAAVVEAVGPTREDTK